MRVRAGDDKKRIGYEEKRNMIGEDVERHG